jgi:hypothetical protein
VLEAATREGGSTRAPPPLGVGRLGTVTAMASRQEEKEQRRQERMALEQQEAAAAARKKRLGYVLGGLLGLAALAGVVFLIVSLSGGGNDDKAKTKTTPVAADLPKLPPQAESDWQKAAKAAGCELINPPYEGAGHAEKKFTPADFKTNPPTSGQHFPTWYDDGEYEPGTTPDLGQLVHTLEHGRINIQYKAGTPQATVDKLRSFFYEQNDGYHMLIYENTTNMKYAVAATAWTHLLGCTEYNDKVIDALRTFRARYIDKGPETVA